MSHTDNEEKIFPGIGNCFLLRIRSRNVPGMFEKEQGGQCYLGTESLWPKKEKKKEEINDLRVKLS